MASRPEPVRMCVGCRARGAKGSLVRIVRSPVGEVAVDPTGRAAGRGAYVHPDEGCVRRALRAGSLARALRTAPGATQTASLIQELRSIVGDMG